MDLKVEKMIARPAPDVFAALKEGRLFMNCSADSRSMKIDFRVGGKYEIMFQNMRKANFGEFLEIVPNKKIVFTWCQEFGPEQKPDTRVTIELFADGPKTRVVVAHTGFRNKEICDGHIKGWTGGLEDLGQEMEHGTLRLVRTYPVPVEKLYAACANPSLFFGAMGDVTQGTVDFKVSGKYQVPTKKGEVKGEFLTIAPNEKIAFSWLVGCTGPVLNSRVTLTFSKRDNGSAVELVHTGLQSEDDQRNHRAGWEFVTATLLEQLAK